MKKTEPIKTKREANKLLRYLKDWNGAYYVAALLGMSWGLRCSDILALKVGDVLAGAGKRIRIEERVCVREKKTGHERLIVVTELVRLALANYLARRKKKAGKLGADEPLIKSRWKTRDGEDKALTRRRLLAVVSKACADVGIKGCIGMHGLRKTFAHIAWLEGTPVEIIQKELGHASIEHTYRYACIPREEHEKLFRRLEFSA